MHYRSVADLNDTILQNLHKLPSHVDMIVGIPRSGLLAANLLCLALNVPLADVDGFLEGKFLIPGVTRKIKNRNKTAAEMRTVVVIDDSIRSGETMRKTRARFDKVYRGVNFVFCAVYGLEKNQPGVDIVFEAVPPPRMFQWNLMHHSNLTYCCVDIDGVLCLDPTADENDDGPAYEKFLAGAIPLLVPSQPIKALVTSRLEKYRELTEKWLGEHGIEYQALHMLNVPSRQERIRLGLHGQFKADIYAASDAILFIESEYGQAREIAKKAGKPVLCIETQHIIYPSPTSPAALRHLPSRLRMKYARKQHPLKTILPKLIGERPYTLLKTLAKKTKNTTRLML